MINRFCKKPLLECSFQPASLCGGATRRTPSCCPHPTCFNPRAREGSTVRICIYTYILIIIFTLDNQSAP